MMRFMYHSSLMLRMLRGWIRCSKTSCSASMSCARVRNRWRAVLYASVIAQPNRSPTRQRCEGGHFLWKLLLFRQPALCQQSPRTSIPAPGIFRLDSSLSRLSESVYSGMWNMWDINLNCGIISTLIVWISRSGDNEAMELVEQPVKLRRQPKVQPEQLLGWVVLVLLALNMGGCSILPKADLPEVEAEGASPEPRVKGPREIEYEKLLAEKEAQQHEIERLQK